MIPRRFFWIFDVLVLAVAFLLAALIAPAIHQQLTAKGFLKLPLVASLSPEQQWSVEDTRNLLWVFGMAVGPIVMFLDFTGRDGRWQQQSSLRIVSCGMAAPFAGLAVITVVPFILRSPTIRLSRLLILCFMLVSAIGFVSYRLSIATYWRRRRTNGHYAKNIVIIGVKRAIDRMEDHFARWVSKEEYRLLGYLEAPGFPCSLKINGDNYLPQHERILCLGKVDELGDLLIHRPIHEVIAIQPQCGCEWMQKVIKDCDDMGTVLRLIPEALLESETVRLRAQYPIQALRLPAVVMAPPHWDSDALFIKRLIDFFISSILLIVLSPIFLLIAVAIKLTSPDLKVFYKWRVIGMNGVEFTGYKFTSMAADADERKQELMDLNEMSGPVFKIKDDPRVTPMGRFLRKFSLNELPQLWSVLKGDMSLVGPRPAFRHELERYEFWHKRKLSIKPGITCLWQIRGRNKIHRFDEWVAMDLEYIDNWSLWLDFKILLRTAWVVIAGTGS